MRALSKILYPPKCVFCDEMMRIDAELAICDNCSTEVPLHMYDYLMENRRPGYVNGCDRVMCGLWYSGMVKDSMRRYKFGHRPEYGKTLGAILAEKVARVEGFGAFDVVTEVPLSRVREHVRGYSQAKILAEYVAMYLNAEFVDGLLVMRRDAQRQSGLNIAERKRNAGGAYLINEDKAYHVSGQSILLIDDISTTLSTLNACAALLKERGATSVVGAVAASALMGKAL